MERAEGRSLPDDERRRIARELHDQVAHTLNIALNSFELHQIHRYTDPVRAQRHLHAGMSAVRRSLETVSALCADLRARPGVGGLDAALRGYLRTAAPPEIYWVLRVTGDDSGLLAGTRDELFLTLREAIRNALIHSAARRLDVEVRIEPDAVHATVSDDGIGFDAGRQPRAGGLVSMRERVELLGGSITISSTPSAGTVVHVRLPR